MPPAKSPFSWNTPATRTRETETTAAGEKSTTACAQKFPPAACYILQPESLPLARKLAQKHTLTLFTPAAFRPMDCQPFERLSELLRGIFTAFETHIFISSTSAAVHALSHILKQSEQEPAVLVVDPYGAHVICLLKGRQEHGNAACLALAATLKSHPVPDAITPSPTLSTLELLARKYACHILDPAEEKHLLTALPKEETIPLYDPLGIIETSKKIALSPTNILPPSPEPAISVHWRYISPRPRLLRMTTPCLYAGIGCRAGTSKQQILNAFAQMLQTYSLEKKAVKALASIEAKKNEQGLCEAAEHLALPLYCYDTATLAQIDVPHPSAKAAEVFQQARISVSEGAALQAAGFPNAELLVTRQTYDGCVTLAIALPHRYRE